MRVIGILLLILQVAGAAVIDRHVNSKRNPQDLGSLLSGLLGSLSSSPLAGALGQLAQGVLLGATNAPEPVKIEKLQPTLRPDAKRVKLYYGPFNIFGQQESHSSFRMPLQMDPNSMQINRPISGFCNNCTVLYGKADTHYENGTRAGIANGIYVHHIVVVDMGKRGMPFYLCDGQKEFLGSFPGAGFIVAGNDEAANYYTTPDGKFKSGYYIAPKGTNANGIERVGMQAEIINYKPHNQTFYITTEIEYLEGKQKDFDDSTVSLLSMTGCKPPDYHVQGMASQYNMSSVKVRMPMDGHIINSKDHLHDGGANITLMLNDKPICNSQAIYGGDGSASLAPNGKQWQTIRKMTQCTDPVRVKAGDTVSMKALYDREAHPLRQAADGHGDGDEMGVFFINFARKLPKV